MRIRMRLLGIVAGVTAVLLSVAVPVTDRATAAQPSAAKAYRPTGALAAVSCISAKWCRAVSAYGAIYAWNGHRWTKQAQVGPNDHSDAVRSTGFNVSTTRISCTSTSFCMATYAGDPFTRSTNQRPGTAVYRHGKWTTSALPYLDQSYELSCHFHGFCMQLGYEDTGNDEGATIVRLWNGSRWRTVRPSGYPTRLLPSGLSCVSSSSCTSVYARHNDDELPNETHALRWNGHAWKPEAIGSAAALAFTATSCPTRKFCAAVTSRGYGFVRHGSGRWGGGTHVAGASLESVSCASARYCVAVGENGVTAIWNGARWRPGQRLAAPRGDGAPHGVSISCPAPYTCHAVTDEGAVYRRGSAGVWHMRFHA